MQEMRKLSAVRILRICAISARGLNLRGDPLDVRKATLASLVARRK
jgi:hypothetical protein